MTNEMLVFLSGMAAAFTAGAALAFVLGRRPGAIPPAVEAQWLAEIAGLRAASERQQADLAAAGSLAAERDQELDQLRGNLVSLQHQVASYLKQYAVAKDTLKKEILQKNALRTELAAAQAEVEALRGRVMELRLEIDPGASRRALSR